MSHTLSSETLAKMDAYWRAANDLSVGQIYLRDNPLLERSLTLLDIKPRLLGQWGTTPGLNLLYEQKARALGPEQAMPRPRWPMIGLRTPKGWTGPKRVDNKQVEGSWRSHQVPISEFKSSGHVEQLENWLKSYRPEELFDEHGQFRDELAALAPTGQRRMGCNPHANGGALLKPLVMPAFRDHAVAVPKPGATDAEPPAHAACLAAGPQRVFAQGSRLHRPRGQQEGRGGAPLHGRRRGVAVGLQRCRC